MSTNDRSENREHVSRREALRRGALGAAGVVAAGSLCSRGLADEALKTPEQKAAEEKAARDEAARAKAKKGQTKSVIQIFLWGGMSHNDAWDPKPGTGYEYLSACWANLGNSELSWIPSTLVAMNLSNSPKYS